MSPTTLRSHSLFTFYSVIKPALRSSKFSLRQPPIESAMFPIPDVRELFQSISGLKMPTDRKMITDLILQAVLILVSLFMFLWMNNIPQKYLSKLRYRNKSNYQAKRHFILGAQLLAQARSAKDRSSAASLAKSAAEEADRSIKLDPKDAAAHILLALALDLQGFKTSALDAIDVALSPLAAKSLSGEERGDALFKRAEIKVGLKRRGRVDSVVEDLVESVRLKKDNARSFSLLGECYEMKEMKAEARKAYEDALRVEPNLNVARQALDRLRS